MSNKRQQEKQEYWQKKSVKDWLVYCRDYMQQAQNFGEAISRLYELLALEKQLQERGILPTPDSFEEGFEQVLKANKQLGWVPQNYQPSEDTKTKAKKFCEGKAAFLVWL